MLALTIKHKYGNTKECEMLIDDLKKAENFEFLIDRRKTIFTEEKRCKAIPNE